MAYLVSRKAISKNCRRIPREEVARGLGCTVRQVQEWAEQSRLAGDPNAIVCYTSARPAGYYIADGTAEIKEMKEKVLRECRQRLRQCRRLREAIRKVDQGSLF